MESAGMGRLVTFDSPQPLTTLIDRIAEGTGYPGGIPIAIPQSASVDELMIRTVGVCPGSGSSVLMKGDVPDLLFTGEMSHHEALAAIERGKVVVALAHSNTERGYLRGVMRGRLAGALKEEWDLLRGEELKRLERSGEEKLLEVLGDAECEVLVSETDRDPYGIMLRRG
ncbi:hypothetical protein ETB97_010626 [Aspergillus alliaceus]|uniref:Uncharacterized protein n=2 Tax=Petromyces alliaceus TaxID=209559 RepID=A0A8H6E0L4_PETAA|nr:hypothetical protein ETB97_010626 [Aspergillus burnettii]